MSRSEHRRLLCRAHADHHSTSPRPTQRRSYGWKRFARARRAQHHRRWAASRVMASSPYAQHRHVAPCSLPLNSFAPSPVRTRSFGKATPGLFLRWSLCVVRSPNSDALQGQPRRTPTSPSPQWPSSPTRSGQPSGGSSARGTETPSSPPHHHHPLLFLRPASSPDSFAPISNVALCGPPQG